MPAAHTPAVRSRLDQGRDVYEIALGVADRLDAAGMDLWAAGVRSCLDAPGSTERQWHLAAELTRLSHTALARREGLGEAISGALSRLSLGLGDLDVAEQPLYNAVRGLAEHLELHGGRRWLGRLRTVMADTERLPSVRIDRLGRLLARMEPGAEGLPEGTSQRVRAVAERLPRHRDADRAAAYVSFALRPPLPSRMAPVGDHVSSDDGIPGGRPAPRAAE